MKRAIVVFAILLFVAASASAQTYDEFQQYFEAFANEVANSLPITATIGANWSPAYIGQFPHFGVGVSLGGMFLPYDAIEPVVDNLGVGASIPDQLKTFGVPFPAVAIDARIGGFGIPFDIGLKYGAIPDDAQTMISEDVTAEYLMAGIDFRMRLIEGKGILPTISAGAGYSFLRGALGINDVSASETIDITAPMNAALFPGPHSVTITSPDLVFRWDTHSITTKAQASWDLSLLTPHLGIGAAYGISEAGGGLFSSLSYTGGATFDDVEDVFDDLGYPIPTAEGIEVLSKANGWSFWVYGGTAFNLGFISLDLSALYNFVGGAYGASANLRFQY